MPNILLPRKKTKEEIERDQDIIDTVLAIWGLLTIAVIVGWVCWRARKNRQRKNEDGVELMEVHSDDRGSWRARARAWYRSNVPYTELHDPW
jgi:hypothetical protein